ncbi:hypothetical protein DL546_000138 [Coniochaeta pulveracea]|uniref:Thioredoxin domain-containing protein n=1 Tax=Coniochaeta pulveracea TaxID=177199 RepID=A0A420XW87_9PEZI|nr:hypothetical protein DL546_000138 [Coniochaeta pulveracea]
MSFRTSLRPLTRLAARPSPVVRASIPRRAFHPSPATFIKVGDVLPDMDVLQEGNPGNKVNLAHEVNVNGDAIIIGVPAAFSPSCSATHVPGYIQHPKTKDFPLVAVVSVNDVFVMKAWGEQMDPAGQAGFRFLADPAGEFTKAIDMDFENKPIFGGDRSKRYTLVIKDGKVASVNVEPDNTGVQVSVAEKVLG